MKDKVSERRFVKQSKFELPNGNMLLKSATQQAMPEKTKAGYTIKVSIIKPIRILRKHST
jgi:hypothetical protein